MRKIWRPTLLGLGFATWIAAVAFGLTLLMQYENRSGPQAQSPELWPAESRLPRAADQWTLLMFLHPRCACSQASLDELGSLLAECPGRAAVCLVFYKPAGFPDGWERTSLWDRASALADTVLVCDVGEVERQRFGVLTSGQALLYDRDGQLRYRGGLTRARGVRGTSRGRESLSAMLTGENADWALAPVFGCPLVSDDAGASRRTD